MPTLVANKIIFDSGWQGADWYSFAHACYKAIPQLGAVEKKTIEQAIQLSGVLKKFPGIDLAVNKVGIFSKLGKLYDSIYAFRSHRRVLLVVRDVRGWVASARDRHTQRFGRRMAREDLGYWTSASLDGRRIRPASSDRHSTHALMMDVLHRMTGNDVFWESARRWRGYAQDPRCRARTCIA